MTRITVVPGRANPALAQAIAADLDTSVADITIERFPDGEVAVELHESVRDRIVFIVQPTSPPVNENLLELVAIADATRRAAARRIVAVVPYFGYARADRRKSRRVPVMARAVADLLEASGVQHLVSVDLHSAQVEAFFRIPVENLTALPTLGAALRDSLSRETVIVSPDLGAVERATTFAEMLGCQVAVLAKRRLSGSEVEIRQLIGDVEDRAAFIIDDMISTGATIVKGMEALRAAGAHPTIRVAATHGVFSEGALDALHEAGIEEVVVTDTIPGEAKQRNVRRISIAPLLAAALKRIAVGESLRDLY